jgi:hypothetical protein
MWTTKAERVLDCGSGTRRWKPIGSVRMRLSAGSPRQGADLDAALDVLASNGIHAELRDE